MPHDCRGRLVEVGQTVIVRFKVLRVVDAGDFCNVDLESIVPMPGNGIKTTLGAINTKQTEVVGDAPQRSVFFGSERFFRGEVM